MTKSITKGAAAGGVIGLLIMLALWMAGMRAPLWALFFWPSQFVGFGTDGIRWLPEITIQFCLYAFVGSMAGFLWRAMRGEN